MSVVVVAEKPSVARDIAAVLGARSRGEGYFHGEGWIVTWAIGHLVALAEPGEMNPAWKKWRLEDLPLLPSAWPLVVVEQTRAQFAIVKSLIAKSDVRGIVSATDAGREGELIFRYIYEAAKTKKPVKRLWISSLTPAAIAAGFRALKDGSAFDRLADAARGRSRADWLVGMNLSRVYSVLHDDNLSVGRVQTPTLAMIVARELEIRDFVPEDYLEVVASFAAEHRTYDGTYVQPNKKEDPRRLPIDGEIAAQVVARAKVGNARVASVDRQTKRMPPPQLYDLTELQRHANRLYGFTAQRTLTLAQTLYEQRKLLSYPRTDSKHLSQAIAATLPGIVAAIEAPYRAQLASGTGTRPLGPRFVDDARVTDHHALLPTETRAPDDLHPDERRIYDLVCRRLLQAWHGDHVYAVTTVTTEITTDIVDKYVSSGTSIEDEGWKILDVKTRSEKKEDVLPGGLAKGMPCVVEDAKAVKKTTRPPPRLTDGTLLTAMETAGKTLDEKELSDAMRDRGLGTPATRASILETLLRREYIVREGKALSATDKGIALIAVVHPHVKSPAMTGDWEAKLARMERGEVRLADFMDEIARWVSEVIGSVSGGTPPDAAAARVSMEPGVRERASRSAFLSPSASSSSSSAAAAFSSAPALPSPQRRQHSTDLRELLADGFGFASFRPYQEDVCRAAAEGRDVLLVMPTGAGKSLCYQLPGLARGGTTLVISPLIALMEDQVAALVKRGFVAERIHSGRDRNASRAACRAYLAGELDFLFIAPERLRVPGFPEMLARRKPTLIAIDEAHCISQWGHDFRPDYRMLGERLPLLRPAPVIALTATATPAVQDDILAELRLEAPLRSIHGFRRTNIAVEVIERNPSDRAEVVKKLLSMPGRIPAIVYAPTRAESERLVGALEGKLRTAAYHAGLGAAVRDKVQTAFLASKLDVIVATTAFGMGIDKPDVRTVVHAALPASVEGYYQEIGRAGRDGAPSRAVLLHSFVDSKTHEFFLERDYPESEILAKIQKAAQKAKEITADELRKKMRIATDLFEKALEKLWIHGGVLVDASETVRPGTANWRPAYEAQRAHKAAQLEKMRRYADTQSCRMIQLVGHFGDREDAGTACGTCDVCAPKECIAQSFREPSAAENTAAARILTALAERDGRSVGQLQRDVLDDIDRRALDHILGALVRAGALRIEAAEFEKDGKTIPFQKVYLARSGSARSELRIVEMPVPKRKERAQRAPAKAKAQARGRRSTPSASSAATGSGLETDLRSWRTIEAKRRKVPPFRVMNDRTIREIAVLKPVNADRLLEIHGMGEALLAKYGNAILALIARHKD